MKTVIEMARESWLDIYVLGKDHASFVEALERFATLVRADEREAFAKIQFESILQAIRIEREACAKVCDEAHELMNSSFQGAAASIRARGEIK